MQTSHGRHDLIIDNSHDRHPVLTGTPPEPSSLSCMANPLAHLLFKLECHLNASATPSTSSAGFNLVQHSSAPTSSCPLLVVITTHRRALQCTRLLHQLREALDFADRDAHVVVINDPSSHDYAVVRRALARLFPASHELYQATEFLGKTRFWAIHQQAFDVVRMHRPGSVLFLQDDVELAPRFFERLQNAWGDVTDPRKAALYLCAMDTDEPDGRWIRFRRSRISDRVNETRWLDLQGFYAVPRFFELLHHRVFPIPLSRWEGEPEKSSGVGEQFTRRLLGRGAIYQVRHTLLFHGGSTSLMNPEARHQNPFDNRPIPGQPLSAHAESA